jgi:hypothetical protein
VVSAGFFASTHRSGPHADRNLEAIVHLRRVLQDGGYLATYYLAANEGRWQGPIRIEADGTPITEVTGTPVMLQGDWGPTGNFELLVPQGNRLVHYWRDVATNWHRGADVIAPTGAAPMGPTAVLPHAPDMVAFFQSNFMRNGHGTCEVVARMTSQLDGDNYLTYVWSDPATGRWSAPKPILVGGQPIRGVAGRFAFFQSDHGREGHFELVVSHGDRVTHYRRNNDDPAKPWSIVGNLPLPASGAQSGESAVSPRMPVDVSGFSGTYRSPRTLVGNLEVAVHMRSIDGSTDHIDTYWYSADDEAWHGPSVVRVGTTAVRGVAGL